MLMRRPGLHRRLVICPRYAKAGRRILQCVMAGVPVRSDGVAVGAWGVGVW